VEVLYTVIQSLTMDGRDRGLDYKLSGFHVPPGSRDAQVLGLVGLKGQSGAGDGWVEGAVRCWGWLGGRGSGFGRRPLFCGSHR
jgi:hypothetical protein